MARPAKRKVPGSGRVTPKKGEASAMSTSSGSRSTEASSRYTPPVPHHVKTSPPWVPILMFTLLGMGMVVIFLNYVQLLPGATSNAYLGVGLAAICGGIVTATQYR
jgi:hypothetical protein